MSVEIVFHNAVRSAVGYPQGLIGRDQVRVWRRSNSGLPHIEELAVLIEHLNPAMSAIDNEQAAVVADLNAVNGVELIGAGILRIFRRRAPIHQEFSNLVEFGDARSAVSVADKERAV